MASDSVKSVRPGQLDGEILSREGARRVSTPAHCGGGLRVRPRHYPYKRSCDHATRPPSQRALNGEPVAAVDSLDGVKCVVDGLGPGQVDEIILGRRLSEHTVNGGVWRPRGPRWDTVAIEPDPSPR